MICCWKSPWRMNGLVRWSLEEMPLAIEKKSWRKLYPGNYPSSITLSQCLSTCGLTGLGAEDVMLKKALGGWLALLDDLWNRYPFPWKKELKKTLPFIWDYIPEASLSLSTCGLTGLGAELFLLLNCRSSSWVDRHLMRELTIHYNTIQYNITMMMIHRKRETAWKRDSYVHLPKTFCNRKGETSRRKISNFAWVVFKAT